MDNMKPYENEWYELHDDWENYYTEKPVWERVSKSEFQKFLKYYPRELTFHNAEDNKIYTDNALTDNGHNSAWKKLFSNVAIRECMSGETTYDIMKNYADVYASRFCVRHNIPKKIGTKYLKFEDHHMNADFIMYFYVDSNACSDSYDVYYVKNGLYSRPSYIAYFNTREKAIEYIRLIIEKIGEEGTEIIDVEELANSIE